MRKTRILSFEVESACLRFSFNKIPKIQGNPIFLLFKVIEYPCIEGLSMLSGPS